MNRIELHHVAVWASARPDEIGLRFHNMLLQDPAFFARLDWLLSLFSEDPPIGTGLYNHHDGMR